MCLHLHGMCIQTVCACVHKHVCRLCMECIHTGETQCLLQTKVVGNSEGTQAFREGFRGNTFFILKKVILHVATISIRVRRSSSVTKQFYYAETYDYAEEKHCMEAQKKGKPAWKGMFCLTSTLPITHTHR